MSVYRVIDVVGTSTSMQEAAADAINTARQSVRDLRVAEVAKQDIHFGTAAISSTARRSSCPSVRAGNRRARKPRIGAEPGR
jgi:flavin-binding protein dodecin